MLKFRWRIEACPACGWRFRVKMESESALNEPWQGFESDSAMSLPGPLEPKGADPGGNVCPWSGCPGSGVCGSGLEPQMGK
jgi:hypothetical protein